jgi:hypothetical protein
MEDGAQQVRQMSPDGLWWWDGLKWAALSEEERQARLAARVRAMTQAGWVVVQQTPSTAQLIRPKQFSAFWAIAWFLLCGVGVLVYVFYYMGKKDGTAYLTSDDPVTASS